MIHAQIRSYSDFVETLLEAGFSMGGGNSEGIYSVINWGWNQRPAYDTPVSWHTGNWDTDPWEWRIRVLEEHEDIAYAKLFFKKRVYCKGMDPPVPCRPQKWTDTGRRIYGRTYQQSCKKDI